MALTLPLRDRHAAAGAAWTEHGGWEVPAHYGDAGREYAALRGAAGLRDLSHRGRLEVRGTDRADFLQALLSNDVKSLAPGRGCRAVAATAKGRILADLRVYADPDAIRLDLPPGRAEAVAAHLDRHHISEQVEIRDRGAGSGMIGLTGPAAPELLRALAEREPPPLPPHGHAVLSIAGAAVHAAAAPLGRLPGFDLWIPAAALAAVWDLAVERGRALGAVPAGEDAFNIVRVEEGVGRHGDDFDETNFPQEAGLDDAVSYTKGCYLGQEVIARIHYQGHVNRVLAGLEMEGTEAPPRGAEVTADGKPAGHVTSAARSPRLGRPIALAMLQRAAASPNTPVEVRCPAGPIPARTVPLPFAGTAGA